MELAFLIPLLKDGADSVGGGVAINDELVFKPGVSQNGGGANCIHQGVECGFKFVVPVKLPSSRTVSDERVKRCGQHAEITDVHAIEIQEAKECPYFLQGRGSFPILHALDFDRVHGNCVFTDDNTKVFDFALFELAFLRFQIEIVDCEDAQNIVHYSTV